jgi:hypothetical protein
MTATTRADGGGWARVEAFRARHPALELVLFFCAGFLFDLLTLGRIDSPVILFRQGMFLCVLAALLLLEHRHRVGLFVPTGRVASAWAHHEAVLHFLFGGLLSHFTLFYFKSASGIGGRGFLVLLAGLLVANELPVFRRLGPLVRSALFAFSLASYLAYLLPVLAGMVQRTLFILAMVLAAAGSAAMFLGMLGWERQAGRAGGAWKQLAAGWGALVLLFVLYEAKAIPPVPLSVRVMGLYHRVEHVGARYRLERERMPGEEGARWPWQREVFHARNGEKVHVFARIFAPRAFKDRVYVRWMRDEKGEWRTTDRIPLTVRGGREDGYAGYAWKQNFQAGIWRVDLETEDGRTVGRMDFDLEQDDGLGARAFASEWR